jgi:hypothetical protein
MQLKQELKGNRGAFFYRDFGQAMADLETEGIIEGIKSSKKHMVHRNLFNRYQMGEKKEKLNPAILADLLSGYNPAINTSFYFKNAQEWEVASPYLKKISSFLNQKKEDAGWISLNERSYDLFGNEKFLASKEGKVLLKNSGLTIDDLCCFQTSEPFFYFLHPSVPLENILIIENKDTFFSLKRLLQDGVYDWDNKRFSLLIYGEGNKITKSIEFLEELEIDEQVPIYYYGDLDPEGISIYYRTKSKTKRDIQPFKLFYEALWERKNNSRKWANHRCSLEALQEFLSHFPHDLANELEVFLNSSGCVPQEGLHLEMMRRLADGTG